MSDRAKTVYSCNLSFLSMLTIAFIVLKLTHVIDWSWWFVLMPLYLPASLLILGLVVTAIICYVVSR